MICFSFDLPGERGPLVIVLILTKENMERMKAADPFDVKLQTILRSSVHLNAPAKAIDLVIAYEEDEGRIAQFAQEKDLVGLLQWIERGRKVIAGDVQKPTNFRKQ